MPKLSVGKPAAASSSKPAATAAKTATSSPQKGKGSATTSPTRRVAVKGKGLYVPNIRVEEFTIPGVDVLNVPSDSPFDFVWGLYAEKGWGKSSFANLFGLEADEVYDPSADRRCLSLMTEPMRRGLEIRMVAIPQASYEDMRTGNYKAKYTPWEYCKGYLQAAIDDDSVRMICIDSFPLFCDHAMNHWCKLEEVSNPTQKNDHGRLWSTIKTDVLNTLMEVKETGRGLILTAHDKKQPIDDPIRGEYFTMQPSFSDWPYGIWKQVTDFVLYGVFSEHGRSIFVRGNQYLHASSGTKQRFLAPDANGNLFPMASFSAGSSEEEAYTNFLRAFDNEQPAELWFHDLPLLAEKAAKKKGKKSE